MRIFRGCAALMVFSVAALLVSCDSPAEEVTSPAWDPQESFVDPSYTPAYAPDCKRPPPAYPVTRGAITWSATTEDQMDYLDCLDRARGLVIPTPKDTIRDQP